MAEGEVCTSVDSVALVYGKDADARKANTTTVYHSIVDIASYPSQHGNYSLGARH